jgi:hypothetical protein
MPKRRVRISADIQKEMRQIANRRSLPYVGAQKDPDVETESDVAKVQESERFSWESAEGDFIPLTYYPTKTSWPGNTYDHRRTIAAGYDRKRGLLRVKFWTDGAVYDYGTLTPVPPYVAYQFRATQSPGRFINSTLESYGYSRLN